MNDKKRKASPTSQSSLPVSTNVTNNPPTSSSSGSTVVTNKRKKREIIPLEGIVNGDDANQKVWLVKIPDFIDLEQYKDDEPIGSVIIEENTLNKKTDISLNITPPQQGTHQNGQVLTQFSLQHNKKRTPMYVFSFNKLTEEETQDRERLRLRKKIEPLVKLDYIDKTEIKILGHVDLSCNAVVKANQKAYGLITKQRETESSRKDRFSQQYDKVSKYSRGAASSSDNVSVTPGTTEGGASTIVVPSKKTTNLMDAYRKTQKSEGPRDNRVRKDEDEIRKDIFNLFKQKKYWKLEDLANETDQPKDAVKGILSKIANYNRAGEFKGFYNLKEEYSADEALQTGTEQEEDEEWEQ
ncbi:hypothetical protein ABK040_004076 [Willaertia magna]